MNINHIIRVKFVVVALAFQIGCDTSPKSPTKVSVNSLPQSTQPSVAKEKPILGSVPEFALIDQGGVSYNETRLDGQLTVVNFFFTQCTATCPKQTQEIARLQQRFSESGAIRFLSVSVQPEVDTPEVLSAYAEKFEANYQRWSFVTGDRAAIWKLSGEGFKLPVGDAPGQSMPIFHSSKFVLVDSDKRIRGYYESQSPQEVAKLVADIIDLIPQSVTNRSPEDTEDLTAAQETESGAPSLSDLEEELAGDFAAVAEAASDVRDIYVPSRNEVAPAWLSSRRDSQINESKQYSVLHDFRFHDRMPKSGIDWQCKIVEDAGKTYVAAHYDHGNGVAIADLDADGLFDIYFTSQIGANALYRNRGDGTFENLTEKAGVGLSERVSVAASFADYDNDGDADLFVTTVRGGNALFRNDGDFQFTDVTQPAGLDYVGHSSAAVFFDFDRDGLLDLFVTNVGRYTINEKGVGGFYRSRSQAFAGHLKPELTETSILYKNVDGTRFEDVTTEMNLIDDSWSGAATPIDVNEDGWPDIYTLDMQGHDEYFENVGGKKFEKRSREVFPKTPWGAMGVKVFDFDNDGRMDIYITDMHSDMSEQVGIEKEKLKANMQWSESMLQSGGQSIWGNALFHKQADGSYKEVSDATGAENYWPWGLSVGDLNADGFEDVFIASSMNLPLRYGINSVLLNDHGKEFLDSEFVLGVEPRLGGRCGKRWFSLDCDGPDREHKYAKQLGITSGKVDVWGALGSRSSVIFDFDNDGDLDIITNDFNSPPMVLESNLAEKHQIRFLKVKLVGKSSNQDGLGAIVEVITDSASYKKVHDGQSGYLSQSSHELYFGLAEATKINEVLVTWPSGLQQTVKPNEINSVQIITEEAN